MTMVGGFSCHTSRQKSTSVLGRGPAAGGQDNEYVPSLLKINEYASLLQRCLIWLTLSGYEFISELVALQNGWNVGWNKVNYTHTLQGVTPPTQLHRKQHTST